MDLSNPERPLVPKDGQRPSESTPAPANSSTESQQTKAVQSEAQLEASFLEDAEGASPAAQSAGEATATGALEEPDAVLEADETEAEKEEEETAAEVATEEEEVAEGEVEPVPEIEAAEVATVNLAVTAEELEPNAAAEVEPQTGTDVDAAEEPECVALEVGAAVLAEEKVTVLSETESDQEAEMPEAEQLSCTVLAAPAQELAPELHETESLLEAEIPEAEHAPSTEPEALVEPTPALLETEFHPELRTPEGQQAPSNEAETPAQEPPPELPETESLPKAETPEAEQPPSTVLETPAPAPAQEPTPDLPETEPHPEAETPEAEHAPSTVLETPAQESTPPSTSLPDALSSTIVEDPPASDFAHVKPWLAHYPSEVPALIDYPSHSIAHFLIQAAEKFPRNEAVHFLGKSVSYRELYQDACRLANGLIALGVGKGERVAIMLPNCPQAVVSYYAVLLLGAVVVQTNPLYVERELEHQLSDSGATTIITVDLLYARLARVRGEHPESGPLPGLRNVIVTSIKDGLPFPKNMLYPIKQRKEGFRADIPYGTLGVVSYRRLLAAHSSLPVLSDVEANDIAQLQYTGGTTGTPKGVMLSHRNLVSNTMQTSAWCYKAQDGKEKFLAALPLFHVFGLTVLMNMSVLRAGSLILLPKFESAAVLQTISKQKPTIFPGAPTMYVALINHKDSWNTDMSSIEVCISGSAALPLEVQEQFEKLTGGRLIEGFGLTEASPVTHANPIWGRRKIGTIGLPFPDTEAAVVNAEGLELPVGAIGELVVRGPQVMLGYWNHPEESEHTLRGGWLHTGDLAYMDSEGYFTIVDRMKDVIIAGGFNIYPREVEEVLYEHPAILEASAIGVKDQYRGETVKAFIVLKENAEVSVAQLDLWCRARLAAYKVPHLYEFREALPKTMVGKVLRRKLIEEEAEKVNKK